MNRIGSPKVFEDPRFKVEVDAFAHDRDVQRAYRLERPILPSAPEKIARHLAEAVSPLVEQRTTNSPKPRHRVEV